jgi:hypothetical protein
VRFRSKPLVALSILLILAGAMGGWHDPDDRDDESVTVVHHHTNHDERFTTSHQVAPDHCAFCHWLRTLGDGAPVAVQLASAESLSLVGSFAFVGHVQAGNRLALPARAPPLA